MPVRTHSKKNRTTTFVPTENRSGNFSIIFQQCCAWFLVLSFTPDRNFTGCEDGRKQRRKKITTTASRSSIRSFVASRPDVLAVEDDGEARGIVNRSDAVFG
ncbi:hypothetical protein GWI33_010181 [Rhynchophorus ferrugineus]|uniref:Uncharacterized protein n=1 Tax=Rhynchophorus ferrugineus TaxID=354439 RepID=A0A834MJR9_RHYFE|nr:hypothetical protein GWI33_010181 [Rhynchophorus ferrugineus]